MNNLTLYYAIYAELKGKIKHREYHKPAAVMVTEENVIIAKSTTRLHEQIVAIWVMSPNLLCITLHECGQFKLVDLKNLASIDICDPKMMDFVFETLESYGYRRA